MIQAIVFDLDGTLLNTLYSISSTVNRLLMSGGYREIPEDRFRSLTGNGSLVLMERVLKEVNAEKEDLASWHKAYRTSFLQHCTDGVRPYDGLPSVLTELKQRGIRLFVLTNKDQEEAERVIRSAYGESLFTEVRGKREEFPVKPDPSSLLDLLTQYRLSKEKVLYVGDTGTDMETAKRAELFSVGVLWGYRDREELEASGASAIISRPEELIKFINS